MLRPIRGSGTVLAVVAILAASTAWGQERQVYRYIDANGNTVYSDRPPSGEAKGVQQKRLTGNVIETSEPSLATRQATENFPVTLYTFACGDLCQGAEALLNARGVPFAKVNIEEPQGAQKLKEMTGELTGPVLQVGSKQFAKGFNEARWQALLDEAGYPKTPPRRSRPADPPLAVKAEAPAPGRAETAARGAPVTTIPDPPSAYPR